MTHLAIAPGMPSNIPSAVNINIYHPTGSPAKDKQGSAKSEPVAKPVYTAPIYSYPQTQVYAVPKQSIYQVSTEQPSTPVSVVAPIAPIQAVVPAKVYAVQPVSEQTPSAGKVEVAPAQKENKTDINGFIAKLTGSDYEQQASAMEAIADIAQKSPQQAKALLDAKVIDTLLGIMDKDTTKLEGPSPQQLEIREKIMSGKKVTEAETAQANKMTQKEQAERNKQYAIYTTALLQKVFISEVQKANNTVVPFSELPGSAGIVKQIKNNPNPMVRASGIDALSYIQRPEYKKDLGDIFTLAQKDKDKNVQQAANKAMQKLNPGSGEAKPAEKPADKTAKPEQKVKQEEKGKPVAKASNPQKVATKTTDKSDKKTEKK